MGLGCVLQSSPGPPRWLLGTLVTPQDHVWPLGDIWGHHRTTCGPLGTFGDGHLEQRTAAGTAESLGQTEAKVLLLLAVLHQEGSRGKDTAAAGALGTRGQHGDSR